MKRAELYLFGFLILTLVLSLLNYTWTTLILFIELTGLIIIWLYGYLRNKRLDKGFDSSELRERLLSVVLILGIILNVSEINYSNLITSLGLIILTVFLLIKGIRKLVIKDYFTGIELIIISIIFFGYFMYLRHFAGSSLIRSLGSIILSILYLALSINFIIVSIKFGKQTIGILGIISYWILSNYVNAILFDSFFLPEGSILFYSAFIGSLIVFPILLYQTIKLKDKSLDFKLHINNLYKRFIILIGISMFFAVASPKQFLRLSFGNRPEMINSYFDCSLNNDLDYISKKQACKEFELLKEIRKNTYYPEGLTKEDVEILKQDYRRK